MSEYLHVEKPFLDQLAALGWTVIDQRQPCRVSAAKTDLDLLLATGDCRVTLR